MSSTLYSSGTVVTSNWLNDADTATYNYLTAVAGTNAITATGPVSMTSYTAGDRFYLKPVITNTGAVTININGLGVQPITKNGSTNLVAGDLVIGNVYEIVYDGTLFQVLNPTNFGGLVPVANGGTGATTAPQALINLGATGRLIGMQVFTANGTYTPTSGTTRILAQLQGAGGAGGGSTGTGPAQISMGAGGGAGGYCEAILTSGFSGAAVTLGLGGVGVLAGTGGTGGVSTFAGLTANGGVGGGTSGAAGIVAAVGGLGGTASGGTLNLSGANGMLAAGNQATGIWISSFGAGSKWGTGGTTIQVNGSGVFLNGSLATAAGSGGGGGLSGISSSASTGGNGARGVLVIYEYS